VKIVKFGRLLTAMITPFTSEGTIDWPKVSALIDYLIATGTETIVVAGTTGESPTLSHDEKLELFRRTVQHAAGRVKVMASTGSNNTEASVALTREAEQTGVDGVMLVAPYYNKPSQEGLYRHFRMVAEVTSLPVMVYNIPGRTGVHLTVETMARLAEIDNIVAFKEASGSVIQAGKLVDRVPEGVAVYSGDDALTLPTLAVGGHGIVSVASHLIGSGIQKMMQSYFAGDVQTAAKLHARYLPLFEGLFMAPNPVPVKYALSLKGLCEPHVRLPLVELDEEQKEKVKALVEALKVA
jgi:4-hydroxy-tetrahydrodipicolinate synthase